MNEEIIFLEKYGAIEAATINFSRRGLLLLTKKDRQTKKYESYDLFSCLAEARNDNPHTKFLCKGAKTNVYPSSMCSQMSGGILAYELKLGRHSSSDDLVRIFEFDDENISRNVSEQLTFYKAWIQSLSYSSDISH